MKVFCEHTKTVLLTVLLLTSLGLRAQNGFNIPYSQFGIGMNEQPFNTPMVQGTGGVAYTLGGNNYINPFNPASYGSIETESLVFDMGISIQMTRSANRDNHFNDADGNLGHLLIAMPLTRWWKLGIGLMPFSTVNYESVSIQNHTASGDVKNIYDGTGGINQAFVGMAFNILKGGGRTPSLQVGANLGWLTGSIDRAISYSFQGNDSTFFLNSRRYKHTEMSNLLLDFGLQARQPLGDHFSLGLGVVYKPHMSLTINDMALIYTYHASDESLVDTIFPARGGDPNFKSTAEQANTFGVGVSLERNGQWMVAFDATFAAWTGLKYTEGQTPSILGNSALAEGPYSSYALAMRKLINMDATTYWGRMGWNVGGRWRSGVMHLNMGGSTVSVDEWGIGAGVLLPMRKGRSLLNISLGYSSLGSLDVLQRNCFSISIGVSSSEHWFFKRKYD